MSIAILKHGIVASVSVYSTQASKQLAMDKTPLVDALSIQQADFLHYRRPINGRDNIVIIEVLKFKVLTEKC